mmetsp:Transcript_30511/g.35793  ORF Transcript_30511/g.35793 Transcript_30511/m.35793 type:complete len:119 (-) Transcript_30511:255-611(-)
MRIDSYSPGLLERDPRSLTLVLECTGDQASKQLELVLQESFKGLFFLVNHVVTEVCDVVVSLLARALQIATAVLFFHTLLIRVELQQNPEDVEDARSLLIRKIQLILNEFEIVSLVLS